MIMRDCRKTRAKIHFFLEIVGIGCNFFRPMVYIVPKLPHSSGAGPAPRDESTKLLTAPTRLRHTNHKN